MTRNIPRIHPLPGTTVEPRRRIILPAKPTDQDFTEALRILAEAAEAGEPCPVLVAGWDDGAAVGGDMNGVCYHARGRAAADYTITVPTGGSIALVQAATDDLCTQLRAIVSGAVQWLGDTLLVDLRTLEDFADALRLFGYTVATPADWGP